MTDGLSVTGKRGMPKGIDTVVFDFDDTIADTLAARVDAMRRTFEAAGITSPSADEFLTEHRGVPLRGLLNAFDDGRGAELGLIDTYLTAYWHKEPGLLTLFDGVPELLRALSSAGLRMGVLTSKTKDFMVEGRPSGAVVEMEELGLTELFAHVVGFEDVTNHKPHPEGLERLLGHLGSTPGTTLVVGDAEADIQTAHNAGCWSCLAGWGVPPEERSLGATVPDIVAEHPSALLSTLI